MTMELLRSAWLLPIISPAVRDGVVAVSGSRVVWLGHASDPSRPRGPVRNLGEGVLLPGLVNAHCHLELSHLSGLLPAAPGGFVPWVESVVASRGGHADEEVASATDAAIAGLEASGTVAVGDVSNTLAHLDRLRASSLDAVVFLELLAWDPAKASATLAWGERQLAERASSLRPGLELRLAAHAPHSVSSELLRGLAERGGPASTHLAESPDEARFLMDGAGGWPAFLAARGLGHVRFEPPRQSPTAYVDSLGALHPRLVAAHGVQLDAADRALLGQRGVHIALCPRSNARLGVGRADVPALRAAGVKLCLGSDSLASSPSLDVLDDARALREQFPELEPAAILHMATRGGAEALGFLELGAIAPGCKPALAYAPAERPPADPEGYLLSGEAPLERVALTALAAGA